MKRLGESVSKRRAVADRLPFQKGKQLDNFLKVNENKNDFFPYLVDALIKKKQITHNTFLQLRKI